MTPNKSGRKVSITDEQADRVRALLAEGRTQREVAAAIGVTPKVVFGVARRGAHAEKSP